MVGSGSSLVYTPSVVILGHYFKRYHGIVNGFVTIGSAVLGVALPHVLKFLFHNVGVSKYCKLFKLLIKENFPCQLDKSECFSFLQHCVLD